MAVTVNAGGTLKLASSEEIASLAGAGAVNLQGNVLSVSGASDTTFSGVMSGAGSLVKIGAAVFTLSGANTFSGGVTLSEGSIQAGDNAALGTGTVSFSAGRISSDSATARTLANAFAMSGTLGLGEATNNGVLTLSGNVALGAATTLTVASAATLSGVVSGAYSLTKAGSDELTLSGVNTFSGTTNVDAGVLTLSGGGALINSMAVTVGASGTLKLASSEEIASLAGAGPVNLQGNVLSVSGAADTTFSGVMSGAGSLVKTGAAVFTLSGANTFSGGVTLSDGAIQAGNNTALGTGTVTFSAGRISSDSATARTLANEFAMSGTLGLGDATNNGVLTLSGNVALGAATTLTVASAATLSGVVSGAYSLTKAGSDELNLSGVNTFSGPTNVDAGVLTLSGGSALINSMAVTVNAGGTLKLASSEEIASLAGAGAVNLQGNVLSVSGAADTTFSGVMSGAGSLVKTGAAVFTLSGANTFSGGVTLSDGAIQAGNNAALGTGTVTFSAGRISSDSATARTLANEFAMSGTLGLGDATNNGALTLSGNVALGAATTLTVASAATLSGVVSGAYSLTKAGSDELTLSGVNTFSGATNVDAGVLTLSGGGALINSMAVTV
jgi:autotransporter-associated beta strand protein